MLQTGEMVSGFDYPETPVRGDVFLNKSNGELSVFDGEVWLSCMSFTTKEGEFNSIIEKIRKEIFGEKKIYVESSQNHFGFHDRVGC
jgi:hypothetical protein